ncbi:MAG: prepilin-type N-terminal cleavage/methylation domain-containing protein [Planctomycetota bacterium]
MKSKRGFTIWELLCVIFIIALLLALLMPALSRVRQVSTRMVCGSYLSGYGRAGLIYLNDSDGVFPEPSEWLYTKKTDSKEHPIGCRWHDQAMAPHREIITETQEYQGKMWEYIGEMGIRPCPTFRRYARSRGCENPDHNSDIDIKPQYSYTMNGYLGTTKEGGVLKLNEVRDPGVFFLSEENSWSLRPDHPKYPARWLSAALSTKALDDTVLLISPTPEAKDCFATYHRVSSGGLNRGSGYVLLVDGHVELINVEDQLRKNTHGGKSTLGPAGNLHAAWASETPPPGGWDAQ